MQKCFTSHEGCLEHNFLLQTALEDSRRRGSELCIAWLDLANAFGSVPHSHIFGTLELLGMPASLLDVVGDLYSGCVTQAMTTVGLTDDIPILSGVKQGCPLSPVIFDLAMEPIVRALLDRQEALGYRLFQQGGEGVPVSILAYAVDLSLVVKDEWALQTLLNLAVEVANWSGLQFSPRKCATFHVGRRSGGRQGTVDSSFTIEDSPIPSLREGQHYRHLGVPTGFRSQQTPTDTIIGIGDDLDRINASLLAPWQKLDAVRTFLLPRLDFLLRGADVAVTPLNDLDRRIKTFAKRCLFLPKRASNEPVYLLPSQGGAGLLPLRDVRYALTVAQGFRLLSSPNPLVRTVAWVSLRDVVGRKQGLEPSNEDLIAYLNGSGSGEGGPRSFWARVRRSTIELSKRTQGYWFWSTVKEELQFVLPRPDADPNCVRVHPGVRRLLCQHLK